MNHAERLAAYTLEELEVYAERLRELIASDPVGNVIRRRALAQVERRIAELQEV